ncbi:divergent PAP2 family protein [Paenibacillus cremeus]|uniref:Divergent PAP2 family protein n=1 Tax=Paenibacillus cremeus TaxID=2163881 RepID=A0A559K3L3_9BACL|nr:divergent PAP2 family protein [Paenibacillus cremeus]TVY06721.1 divergent PAP2 family protein [Paenibacillus cremeus]
MNRALWTSIAGIAAAQVLKIPSNMKENGGRWEWRDMFRTGGMPSSHAAGVVSLATYIGMKKGFASSSFAIASTLSLVVMYDAMGIRRQAGLIATEVNELDEKVNKLSKQQMPHMPVEKDNELEERLGHLPAEVLGGALLGTFVGLGSFACETKRKRSALSWIKLRW